MIGVTIGKEYSLYLGVDRYERLVTSFRGFFVGNSFMG
jgi:hypothetical protein